MRASDVPDDEPRTDSGSEKQRKQIAHWIEALESPIKALSAWEQDFLESVSDQFTRLGTLSAKQLDVLEALYDKKG